MSDIHLAFQWLMDPDGDASTPDAPDVVNASWSLTGRLTGNCSLEFADDIRALRGAGVAVVFAAGNDGPKVATSNSPGNNPGVVSVGAIDQNLEIARATSRGPSACDGSVFPSLLAPGVNIPTTDLSHGGVASLTSVSGSSMATPHVAGVMALLMGAFPSASVAELELALAGTSRPGEPVRLNALAAFKALQATQASVAKPAPAVGIQ
jgi:bacillopeptidase F